MASSNIQSGWIDITPELRGYLAHPTDGENAPTILVFIEAYGINDHFRHLAERLAESGYAVLVPDIYHGHVFEYADSEKAIAHLRSLNDEQVMQETDEALAWLTRLPAGNGQKPGVIGFCMGGRYAFMTHGVHSERIAATVSYYGGGIAPVKDGLGRAPLLHLVSDMQAPLLLHYGSDDKSIAPDEHGRIAEALSQHQKRYGLQVYPGAGHGFFCDERVSFNQEAADESLALTLGFFAHHMKE